MAQSQGYELNENIIETCQLSQESPINEPGQVDSINESEQVDSVNEPESSTIDIDHLLDVEANA